MARGYTEVPSDDVQMGMLQDAEGLEPAGTEAAVPKRRLKLFRKFSLFRGDRFCISWHWVLHLLLFILIIDVAIPPPKHLNKWLCVDLQEKIYNDVHEAIAYEDVNFTQIIDAGDKWEGDWASGSGKLWEDLIDIGKISISQKEASRLEAETAPDKDAPGNYLVVPIVFHNLHCLKMMKQFLFGEVEVNSTRRHIDHCIDFMRQDSMCAGNLQPLLFRRNPDAEGGWSENDMITHRCRDWNRLHTWAEARKTPTSYRPGE